LGGVHEKLREIERERHEVDRLDLKKNKWRMRKIEERKNGVGRKKKWRLGTMK
jgi:hypothetical protein